MSDFCLQLLSRNNELEESRTLFSSFINSEKQFDESFSELYGIDYQLIFGNQSKEVFLFNILKNYYQNDFYIRYSFINKILSKSKAISFEEFPIGESRIDLASINGKSVAYEIKTKFDNYRKLKKQIADYSMCFEYVYVICPKENVNKIIKQIPDYCGIYLYHGKANTFFEKYREAAFSPNLNFAEMVKLLRKNELISYFKTGDLNYIRDNYSFDYINLSFKKALKKRFNERWLSIKGKAFLLK